MFILIACALLFVLLFILFRVKTNRRNFLFSKIPSPKKTFFFHNALELFGLDSIGQLRKFEDLHTQFGDVFHVTLHPLDTGAVLIADHKIATAISMHAANRGKSKAYMGLERLLGKHGTFLSSGPHRKTIIRIVTNHYNTNFEKVKNIAIY
jgi:hypothetical protein